MHAINLYYYTHLGILAYITARWGEKKINHIYNGVRLPHKICLKLLLKTISLKSEKYGIL
jgi:hypothetical protein